MRVFTDRIRQRLLELTFTTLHTLTVKSAPQMVAAVLSRQETLAQIRQLLLCGARLCWT